MRKIGWILIGWFSVLLIAGLILIFTAKTKNNPSGPGPGPGPGPECDGVISCPAGKTCTNGNCVTDTCGGPCPPNQFCNDGFCTQCSCKGLECTKVILPASECGGAATQCKVGKGDGCLKPFSPADSDAIKHIVPFICLKSDDSKCFGKNILTTNLNDLNKKRGSYSELSRVFNSFHLTDGYIVSNIDNTSMNFDPEKIKAGFFKLCGVVMDIFNTVFDNIGVFVYDYDAALFRGKMHLASYAYTYKDTTSPTYIQGTYHGFQSGPAAPKITSTFKFPPFIPVDLNSTTSIYYPSTLYSSGGAPGSTCMADTSSTEKHPSSNEPGVYLIGNPATMETLGLCTPAPADKTCGEGNYFNQLIGKCICNSCVESDGCGSSLAPRKESQINNLGWWPANQYCPPVCEWQPCYEKEPGPSCSPGLISTSDSDTPDNWSEWDELPSGCKPMHLACLGRGAQKRYRHLKNVAWEYPSQPNQTCKILGNDTTISGTQGEPGPSLPPILPADTLDKDLSNYIPYLGYWKEDGNYVPNPDIYDTDTRPCGVSIDVCGTRHQGGENVSPSGSTGASCKKAGLYWNVEPFPSTGAKGGGGTTATYDPFCSMCHSGKTTYVPGEAVAAYNEKGTSNNISKVNSSTTCGLWQCNNEWCHEDLDYREDGSGNYEPSSNTNGCLTVQPNPSSANIGQLGSSQSACWAYYDCKGCDKFDCCQARCASTICDPTTCRSNAAAGTENETWFKCLDDAPCTKVNPPGSDYKGDGTGPSPGYYTIYGGLGKNNIPGSPGPAGYPYNPTANAQGTKKCNKYGTGYPINPI